MGVFVLARYLCNQNMNAPRKTFQTRIARPHLAFEGEAAAGENHWVDLVQGAGLRLWDSAFGV